MTDMLVETEVVPRCDLCGSTTSELLLRGVRDRYFGLPGTFDLIRCSNCRLVRLSPRPTMAALSGYYPAEGYDAYETRADEPDAPDRTLGGMRDTLRAAGLSSLGYDAPSLPGWARVVARHPPRPLLKKATYDREGFPHWVPGGRALDLGCGNGVFLDRIQRHGWEVVGVDMSQAAADVAKELYDITVHVGPLEEAPLQDGSFDYVQMRHVIEHLPAPLETVRRVVQLLRPGGRVYVETPNIESLSFRWSREFWFPLETPRHLWLFSPETLTGTLERAGLRVTSLTAMSFPTFDWESTYKREDREGRLAERPTITSGERPRAAALTALSRVAEKLSPRFGDILCCWAERPASPTA